jgi:cytochrome c
MRFRPAALLTLAAVAAFGLCASALQPAQGDAASDALSAALKRGEALWRKPMATGAKSCAECHVGPNAMKAGRLKAYPKFDKTLNRVTSGQQKLNQMIVDKSKGAALDLGSDDLNALEAFMSTLK